LQLVCRQSRKLRKWAITKVRPPRVVKRDSRECGNESKSKMLCAWLWESHDEHPTDIPVTKRPRPMPARSMSRPSWCLRHPIKKENAVIGATIASIHKWKLWSTQNEVAIMGKSTTKIGVSKQWTAQTIAIPIPKRSNQAHGCGADVECKEESCI